MKSKTFDTDMIMDILSRDPEDNIGEDSPLLEVKPTGDYWEDGLIEEWQGVFSWEGQYFRVLYRQQSDYLRLQSGDNDGPWIQGETVECIEVTPKQVTITIYEDVP